MKRILFVDDDGSASRLTAALRQEGYEVIAAGDKFEAFSTIQLLTENLLLKKRGKRSQRFSHTDPLTRLFNRPGIFLCRAYYIRCCR